MTDILKKKIISEYERFCLTPTFLDLTEIYSVRFILADNNRESCW